MAPLASAKAMAPLGVLVVHEVVHPARPGFCPREVELPRHFGEPDVADFLVRSPAVAGPTRDDIRHTVSALEVVDKGGADPDTYPDRVELGGGGTISHPSCSVELCQFGRRPDFHDLWTTGSASALSIHGW